MIFLLLRLLSFIFPASRDGQLLGGGGGGSGLPTSTNTITQQQSQQQPGYDLARTRVEVFPPSGRF